VSLKIDSVKGDESITVVAEGELDIATAPLLRDELTALYDQDHRQVSLDLSGVKYIDSTGFGIIVGAHKHLTANGGNLWLSGASPQVRRLLVLMGLDSWIQ
jgi:anti-sigma B factor antagonist